MAKLPDFDKLWNNYPNGEAPEVKKLIGGNVNADWITNTCTIRLSRAFNYSGMKIPYGHVFPGQKINPPKKLNVVKGGDKLWYAYRVAEFTLWVKEMFGAPNLKIFKQRDEPMPPQFAGKRGLIIFTDCGWTDASGHVDLWNKDQAKHAAYWKEAKQVSLWSADKVWQVAGSNTLRVGDTPVVTIRP